MLNDLHNGHSRFVTGKAGTGKSTLIREFSRTAANRGRQVTMTATTGIAALNIGGETVHRLLGLRPSTTVHDVIDGSYRPGRRTAVLRTLQTLVIDEASMLRADTFDTVIEVLTRYGPHPGTWAGGVQLILVGDLHQLPPVVTDGEEDYFRSYYDSPFFFSAHHFDPARLATAKLTKVFRQIGDPTLTDLLNAVRDGLATSHVRTTLNNRGDTDFEPPSDQFWLTLTPTNRNADRINARRLKSLDQQVWHSHAAVTGDLGGYDRPNDDDVAYAVGAQVMLLTNDQADRWVNGTMGSIVNIEADGSATISLRDTHRHVTVTPFTWEVTRATATGGRLTYEVIGTFTQMPFRLAWAITIHKSQGQTLDRLIIDLSGGAFAAGQTYVALSRATSLAGIVLTKPIQAKDLKSDMRVLRFLADRDADAATAPRCAIALTTVGEKSRFDIPRVIEIGIAFSDGTGLSTIVNPQRDPGTALHDHHISNDDLLLAPTLPVAWAILSQFLTGHTLVAADVDTLTQTLAADLKRLDRAVAFPIGTDIPSTSAPTDRALPRAYAALHEAAAVPTDPAAQVFTASGLSDATGYLLSRDSTNSRPPTTGSTTAQALLADSLAVSSIAFGHHEDRPLTNNLTRQAIGSHIQTTISQVGRLSPELSDRVHDLEQLLGMALLPKTAAPQAQIADLLTDGSGVCFTGSATGGDGSRYSRKDMEELAEQHGLQTFSTVTRKNCAALVTAEVGSQSRKAKDAIRLGVPIVSASEFLDWVQNHRR
ncbi:hypothetical protein UG54_00530 [Gordonia sihwensis]|nr:hypothetical protein UG54_00530 [Gordonia sihwensis]